MFCMQIYVGRKPKWSREHSEYTFGRFFAQPIPHTHTVLRIQFRSNVFRCNCLARSGSAVEVVVVVMVRRTLMHTNEVEYWILSVIEKTASASECIGASLFLACSPTHSHTHTCRSPTSRTWVVDDDLIMQSHLRFRADLPRQLL